MFCVFSEKEKPPKWKEGSDPLIGNPFINRTEGTELKLSCSAKGYPRPDVLWMKDEEPFFPRTDKVTSTSDLAKVYAKMYVHTH